MIEYDFTLTFNFSDGTKDPEFYIEKLINSGCDDALIGIGKKGKIALNFTRESDSALTALCSAIEDVKSAIPDAMLIEATPDFVGLSDIAEVLGYSRQNIRKLMLNHQTDFPSPIHEGSSAIWHLSNVLSWFKQGERYQIDESLFDIAKANMQLNIVKDSINLDPIMNKKICTVL